MITFSTPGSDVAATPTGSAAAVQLFDIHASILGALALGFLYGSLVALSPDHLGTVMTLSAAATDTEAFRVGASWGLGHSVGMGVVFMFFIFIEHGLGFSSEGWEAYSDYAVGISLVLCAMYFIMQESQYIKEHVDGTQTILSCECCAPPAYDTLASNTLTSKTKRGSKFCTSFSNKGSPPDGDTEKQDAGEASTRSHATTDGTAQTRRFAWTGRDVKGALIGLVQGVCCPMCLVGASFANVLDAPSRYASFVAMFILSSMVVTGALAVVWSRVTRSGGMWLPPRVLYRATCAFTLVLGIAWIWANAAGSLDALEWTKRLMHTKEHVHVHAQHAGAAAAGR